jgi:hypothetical protein
MLLSKVDRSRTFDWKMNRTVSGSRDARLATIPCKSATVAPSETSRANGVDPCGRARKKTCAIQSFD